MIRFLNEVRTEINNRTKMRSQPKESSVENSGVFDGGFSYGQRTGIGAYLYPNGDYYKGTWINNARNSKGICLFGNSGAYAGSWNGDEMDGRGIRLFPDGDIIEGTFKRGAL